VVVLMRDSFIIVFGFCDSIWRNFLKWLTFIFVFLLFDLQWCLHWLLNPPKNIHTTFKPCHKRTSWHHVSDSLVNTGVSVDKAGDHSVMLIEFK
jgi:hypothetical protein